MNMNTLLDRTLCGLILAQALAASTLAMATDQITFELVPASTCEPIADADKVILENGVWRFAEGQTGTVSLHCPIRSSHFWVSPSIVIYDNQAQADFMDFYDPDGAAGTYSVEAQLRVSVETSATAADVGPRLDSTPGVGDNAVEACLINGNCEFTYGLVRAKYHIQIDMFRGSTSESPRLTAVGLTVGAPG